eukprot:TRINITY_DN15804_c0_g1_i1.p1 TRINITY_DN15804_c0_g1~~TRINITY_DN15804_c0_g1_i1.p1  ORF type:complete len:229 (+),score=14.81 TRINITY_DN15804_c0_g1_i1:187-873(+)
MTMTATVAHSHSSVAMCRGAETLPLDAGSGQPVPDFLFRCCYCIKFIADDSAVYMRHDCAFCSHHCRDRGVSRLYTSLRENQLRELNRWPPSGGSLCSSYARSDSSLASYATTNRTQEDEGHRGRIARLGQRVLDAMLKRVASKGWGAQVLQTYSSGMMWGREITKNTSARALFEFLPEVDHVLTDIQDRCPERTTSNTDICVDGAVGTVAEDASSLGTSASQAVVCN